MSKVFKILSIDGGGIKGLYSSTILEHLEGQIDGVIGDYFDMICGTSTGGLIALALSLGMPATEMSELYTKNGEKIFPKQGKNEAKFRQYVKGGKYSNVALIKVLEETFGKNKLKDCNNLVCIPSYSITDGRPWIFKYGHKDWMDRKRDDEALCVDVALATSAAPTFLPVVELSMYDNKQFIDGGVYANNPTLVGFLEAMTFFVGPEKDYNELEILSISSLNPTLGEKPGAKTERSLRDWKEKLSDTMLNGQAKFIEYFMSQANHVACVPIKYTRIPSEPFSKEHEELISLDNTSQEAIDLIKGKGNDAGEVWRKKEEIKQFFKYKKTYKT